jgi:hypothetical protein
MWVGLCNRGYTTAKEQKRATLTLKLQRLHLQRNLKQSTGFVADSQLRRRKQYFVTGGLTNRMAIVHKSRFVALCHGGV